MSDPYGDSKYSSLLGAKEGFRVYTSTPETGMMETLSVTNSDGLYVAGEKVATLSEVLEVGRDLTMQMVRLVEKLL
ncbi:hypothetical protein CYMTET_53786 [Cymbomonas tetramitiformis]|uniref:Uncharacterized protein n=1 Tax=Cymbomonas tetramitiformis TaxID=36881 RepID=A0AAE0ERD8_9CHLO|nr:hypothetical protein CYMTET_53786 [Cymbomonas tetramitiformis]